MHSMKQSNWILGFGVLVAILLIATTIWIKANTGESNDTVINKPVNEIGETLKKVDIGKLVWITTVLKTIN